MKNTIAKSAFLVPFFGVLPPYFDFWIKSCEINHPHFHWFVYNDTIKTITRPNPAVTLIPFQFDEMKADFKNCLDITIPGRILRRVCDYRLLFYFTRKEKDNLDDFDFIGFTDADMVYGDLWPCMPENMTDYSMISADDGRPCGPFTLMNRSQIHLLAEWDNLKPEMEKEEHHSFNEAIKLMEILSQKLPPFCKADPIQPQMAGMNSRHHFGIWKKGIVKVHDCWQRKRQGGFYHFSRFKDKPRFKIDPHTLKKSSWGIYKFGIIHPDNFTAKIRMNASLYY